MRSVAAVCENVCLSVRFSVFVKTHTHTQGYTNDRVVKVTPCVLFFCHHLAGFLSPSFSLTLPVCVTLSPPAVKEGAGSL